MHALHDLTDVIVLLVATVLILPLSQRLKVSPVLGYLIVGAAIGPSGFAIINDLETASAIAEFGVIFLLFTIGLELSLRRLKVLRRYVFGLGALQVGLTAAAIGAITYGVTKDVSAAIVLGGSLALSSTAVVAQVLVERGEMQTRVGRMAFAILIFQDLAVIPLLTLIPVLGSDTAQMAEAVATALGLAAIALVVIMVIGTRLLPPVFSLIARDAGKMPELFTALTLLVVIGIGALTASAGLSMALGAFLAGVMLSETEFRHQVEADILPFRGLLLALFFMTVGMSVDIGVIQTHAVLILALTFGLLAVKAPLIALSARANGLPVGMSAHLGVLLAEGGEFGFVLLALAVTSGALDNEMAQILIIPIAITMASTPLLATLGKRLSDWIDPPLASTTAAGDSDTKPETVVIAGFGRAGQTVAKLLMDVDIPFIALDMDGQRVARCRTAGLPVFYGNAAQAEALRAAGVGRARAMVLTIDSDTAAEHAVTMIRREYPKLPIYARSHDNLSTKRLETAGATLAVPEVLEASLQLGATVLRSLDHDPDAIELAVDTLRHADDETLREIIGAEAHDQEETPIAASSDEQNGEDATSRLKSMLRRSPTLRRFPKSLRKRLQRDE